MIKVSDLKYSYPGAGSDTIRGLSFSVAKGEIFGFLGPSGAGKSTTQKILTGLIKNYRGSAKVNGVEMNSAKSSFYERIGVGFEFPNFYMRFSAYENLKLFASLYSVKTADPMALLESAGLKDDAHKRCAYFSKGMLTRLNFCRAFLNNPEIVFLDEPTSGLDPANTAIIRSIIMKKREEGAAFFITTHDMNTVDAVCDRAGLMAEGAIVLEGTPHQMKMSLGEKKIRAEYRENGALSHSEFPMEGLGANTEFLKLLNSGKLETLHSQEATLEDVFIKAAGRRLL
jgi:fluoroquinolone transport system ATP-binding protein